MFPLRLSPRRHSTTNFAARACQACLTVLQSYNNHAVPEKHDDLSQSIVQTEDGIPPLTVRPLFSVDATGSVGRCRNFFSSLCWRQMPCFLLCITQKLMRAFIQHHNFGPKAQVLWANQCTSTLQPDCTKRAEAKQHAPGSLGTMLAQLPH